MHMKRFSSKTRGRLRPIWKISFVWLVIPLLLVGFVLPTVFTTVGSVLLYPAHVTRIWLQESTGSLPYFLRQRNELQTEIEALQRELASLSGIRLSYERLFAEHQSLQELVGGRALPERIAAQVVARPTQLPYDILQINVGLADGVTLQAPVYKGFDQVIGFVSHVSEYYSLVTLVTSPGQRATAFILGPDVFVLAEGIGGGILRVRVPQGVPLESGDLVILPAVESGVFGRIEHIETAPAEPQKYGYVPMGISLQSLRFVSVGTVPLEKVSFTEALTAVEQVSNELLWFDIPSNFEIATQTATTTDEGDVSLEE